MSLAPGGVGVGRGVFAVAGSPRRWMRPVLAVLRRQGVLAPRRHEHLPFTVRNTLDADGVLRAERTFRFPRGPFTMHDAVRLDRGRLVDDLGRAARYRATLDASAERGALVLRSTGCAVRVGRRHLPLPRLLAPVVRVHERFDEAAGRQHVDLRLEHPVLGLLYEYRGSFEYETEGIG